MLAGASGLALAATPSLEWFLVDSEIRCIRAPCPTNAVLTGWAALGDRVAVLLLVALAGVVLSAVSILVERRTRAIALSGGVALVGGLLGSALATYIWSAGAGPVDMAPSASIVSTSRGFSIPLVGAWLAPLAAFGVALGAWLTLRRYRALGPRSQRAANVGRASGAGASLVLIASLFLPWIALEGKAPLDAFEAFEVSDLLLIIVALGAVMSAMIGLVGERLGADLSATILTGLGLAGALVSISHPAGAFISEGPLPFTLEPGAFVAIGALSVGLGGAVWTTLGAHAGPVSRGGERSPLTLR